MTGKQTPEGMCPKCAAKLWYPLISCSTKHTSKEKYKKHIKIINKNIESSTSCSIFSYSWGLVHHLTERYMLVVSTTQVTIFVFYTSADTVTFYRVCFPKGCSWGWTGWLYCCALWQTPLMLTFKPSVSSGD